MIESFLVGCKGFVFGVLSIMGYEGILLSEEFLILLGCDVVAPLIAIFLNLLSILLLFIYNLLTNLSN